MDASTCPGCARRDARIAELEAIVATLEAQLAEQKKRVADLEARLKTNSSNSSIPPSANPSVLRRPSRKRNPNANEALNLATKLTFANCCRPNA